MILKQTKKNSLEYQGNYFERLLLAVLSVLYISMEASIFPFSGVKQELHKNNNNTNKTNKFVYLFDMSSVNFYETI